ncbi:MAG: hypothetical protein O9345_05260 [Burkholderiaceae bacterium]|jgi:hypothetical protein|nr:hypothetical protein [Burkholderiales bacterium]MCZ8099164.1 hypothetical protein [Burkholderiales bacterium]MCZ8337553.1 hypothetical protein [Burkholderiaceae bacterium]
MHPLRHALPCALALLGLAGPASAGSFAASSAAGGSSASSAASSASDSSGESSDSSKNAVAALDGPYRIVELTPLPERPGFVRVALAPLGATPAAEPVRLVLPAVAVERGRLAAGATVTANRRPYGVELAHADTKKAFFLVLDDGWQRELRSTPVSL